MGQRGGQDSEVDSGLVGVSQPFSMGPLLVGSSVCILSALRPGNVLSGPWHIQGAPSAPRDSTAASQWGPFPLGQGWGQQGLF